MTRRPAAPFLHRRRPVVLLTGFGPFPGVPANATTILVPILAERAARLIPGYQFAARVLPTEWQEGPRALARHLDDLSPVLAIHFGVSSRARGLVIETRAVNQRCGSADACGDAPGAGRLARSECDVLLAALPSHHIVSRLRRRGIPASISRDAGTYLCNALLWHSRELAAQRHAPLRSGFVHVPDTLVEPRKGRARPLGRCPLDWRQALDGGLEIIAASLGRPRSAVNARIRL